MDEYLTDDDAWLPEAHPLSFRAYLNRTFYDLIEPALAPPPEHRVFPDPRDLEAVPRLIAARGGVDALFRRHWHHRAHRLQRTAGAGSSP